MAATLSDLQNRHAATGEDVPRQQLAQVRMAYAAAMADLEAKLTEHAEDPAAVRAELERIATTRKATADAPGDFRVVMRPYADIEPKLTRWAWDRKLPLGALSLLIGTEGLGKTAVGLALAAEASQGTLQGDLHGTPCNVALFTPEDDAAATIAARLQAAGADMSRVMDVRMRKDATDRGFSLPDDTDAIVTALIDADVKFAFADPLASMLDPRLNSWKDTDVRAALEPLTGAFAEHGITLLGALHTNKTSSTDPRQRGMGSAGWQQIARAALLLSLDPEDEAGRMGSRRCLAHTKHNLGPWTKTRRVELATGKVEIEGRTQETVRAIIGDECDVTANAMLAAEAGRTDAAEAGDGRGDDAARWLNDRLADGPVAATVLDAAAREEGIAWRTVERAKTRIGVESKRVGGIWTWSLPGLPV